MNANTASMGLSCSCRPLCSRKIKKQTQHHHLSGGDTTNHRFNYLYAHVSILWLTHGGGGGVKAGVRGSPAKKSCLHLSRSPLIPYPSPVTPYPLHLFCLDLTLFSSMPPPFVVCLPFSGDSFTATTTASNDNFNVNFNVNFNYNFNYNYPY